jgi:rhomboid protease GluP
MENSLLKNVFNIALNINVRSTTRTTPLGGGRNFRWNSPVILAFCVIVFFVHLAYQTTLYYSVSSTFSVPQNFDWRNPAHYLSLFLYIFGDNGRWDQISTPMLLIVIVGPITEERLGSIQLAFVILITSFIVGLVDVTLFRGGLFGPLCIAYLLIFLATFVNVKKATYR